MYVCMHACMHACMYVGSAFRNLKSVVTAVATPTDSRVHFALVMVDSRVRPT